MSAATSPLAPFLADGGSVVLDGGLATELEQRGADLRDHLWSARLLLDHPDLIAQVHAAYLEAGADVIATASYQASLAGFERRGLGEHDGRSAIRLSAVLACATRDRFVAGGVPTGRRPPLVAGSVGPYGAALADGSEYRGRYGVPAETLEQFHRPRLEELVAGGVDLIMLETFPSLEEALLVLDLLREWPAVTTVVSFSTRDEAHLAEGSSIEDAVRAVERSGPVTAVGVNCLPPTRVEPLLRRMGAATDLPLAAYPNSGEGWDAVAKTWVGEAEVLEPARDVPRWIGAGARLVGGCCRTTPETIRRIRGAVAGSREPA